MRCCATCGSYSRGGEGICGLDRRITNEGAYILKRIWNAGYWISPHGKFFEVEGTHIGTVCRYPEIFGTDERVLRQVFADFGENYGEERMVRELVIQVLVKVARWIRLRNHGNQGWDINVGEINESTMRQLMAFFTTTYGEQVSFDPVSIRSPKETLIVDVAFITRGDWLVRNGFSAEAAPGVKSIAGAGQIPEEEIVPVDLSGLGGTMEKGDIGGRK